MFVLFRFLFLKNILQSPFASIQSASLSSNKNKAAEQHSFCPLARKRTRNNAAQVRGTFTRSVNVPLTPTQVFCVLFFPYSVRVRQGSHSVGARLERRSKASFSYQGALDPWQRPTGRGPLVRFTPFFSRPNALLHLLLRAKLVFLGGSLPKEDTTCFTQSVKHFKKPNLGFTQILEKQSFFFLLDLLGELCI